MPPATTEVPARSEIAASEPAKDQTEKTEATSETLFKQFQAWAADQDANGAPPQPVQGPAAQVEQKFPAPAAENARGPQRLVQKRRPVRTVRNARAEVGAQNLRRPVRRAPVQRAPVQDARAQDQSGQTGQAPSFLPTFGQRN